MSGSLTVLVRRSLRHVPIGHSMMKSLLQFGLVLFLGCSLLSSRLSAQKSTEKPKQSKPTQQQVTPLKETTIDEVVNKINEYVKQGWVDNEVQPSPQATDAEWLRRVYLDLVGHIPPGEEVDRFLADKDKAKHRKLVDKLLEDPGYIRNWTTIWTNNTIGRRTPRRVSRVGMQKFFREAFARNLPWNEIVYELVSAEGHFEENGAVNYLLAQMTMNDNGVQAAAKTTRLFMGLQVQCTQCHDHPFNDWKQSQFWQFNSFFRQMRRVNHRKYDPKSGRQVDDYSEIVWKSFEGPVYFERRDATMRVAYPKFFKQNVKSDSETDRRKELAKLMISGEKPLIATAKVNRMWGHFFGYGFTRPIDDMGPHNAASHPELLDYLANQFVKSGYDLKKLIRWITYSEAYRLTSRTTDKNKIDNPAAGETPLFSHMYLKSMQAEQLYDSLIVATSAHRAGRSDWSQAERQRQQWMQQFVIAFDTDENDETTTFNGTIPQALMLMNGALTENAVNIKAGSYLRKVLSNRRNKDIVKITKLYLATLGRKPSKKELNALSRMFRANRNADMRLKTFQDLFWALLNSNEFIFNH